jgi:release factor glutamine methyltransferase
MSELQTLRWFHQPSGRELSLRLDWQGAMLPSDSTLLLLAHMNIRPGESVLDLGAGNGVLGFAALLLGAGQVCFSDIDPDCIRLIQHNQVHFEQQTGLAGKGQVCQGSLFSPLGEQRFDHILVNPPSIPSPDDHLPELPLAYRSGPDGRLFHDAIQALAGFYLNDGGRLSFVQGSLSNKSKSEATLLAQDYQMESTESIRLPLKPHHPLPWLQLLASKGEAELLHEEGVWYETRCVIQATLAQAAKTGVMARLAAHEIPVRRLPHLRAAPTVALAAAERGVPEHEMIKCILLKDRQKRFVLACLAGHAELDAQQVRTAWPELSRLSFSSPQEITQITGHFLGSVAPISLVESIPVVFDTELQSLQKVNISAGDPRLGLELALSDLLGLLGDAVRFAPIRKESASGA